jgi:hypothetical protein
MEPLIRPGRNPEPVNLRVKPELLIVLRHAGVDLLAYDGFSCSEVIGPLIEAARRIEVDPGLRPVLRSVGWDGDIRAGVAQGLRWVVERCADRLPGVTFTVRTTFGW